MSNPFEAAVETHYRAEVEHHLADPGTRFVARLLDGLAGLAAALPGFAVMFAGSGTESLEPLLIGLGVAGLGYLAVGVYNWVLISTDGTTIGKRAMDIRVVAEDGSPMDFWRGVVMREWVINGISAVLNAFLGGIGGLLGLADALMVFTDGHRTLHDRIAGTLVVRGRVRYE